jgi:hypothetical protein
MSIKNIKRKDHFEDCGPNDRIILKSVLKCGGVNGFHQEQESAHPLVIVKTVTVCTCCNSSQVSRRPHLQAIVSRMVDVLGFRNSLINLRFWNEI